MAASEGGHPLSSGPSGGGRSRGNNHLMAGVLPPAGLRVVEVVDRHVAEELDMTSHLAWAPALTPEQYRERERRLFRTKWAEERLKAWALVLGDVSCSTEAAPGDDGVWSAMEASGEDSLGKGGESSSLEELQPLASLETYRQDAIGPDGEEGSVFGIASVFTQPQHRGRGYATVLCTRIQEELRRLEPRVLGAVLYSDVGDTIYERAGFRLPAFVPTCGRYALLPSSGVRAVPEFSQKTHSGAGEASQGAAGEACSGECSFPAQAGPQLGPLGEEAQPLGVKSGQEGCSSRSGGDDTKALELVRRAASGTTALLRGDVGRVMGPVVEEFRKSQQQGSLLVLPSADQVDWLLEREVCCCEQMGISPLKHCGAQLGATFMLWTMDVSKPQRFLKVLMCHHSAEACDGDLAAVAAAAVLAALEAGAYEGGVLSWGSNAVSGRQGGLIPSASALASAGLVYKEEPREGSLPMLASLRKGVDAAAWVYVPQALWL